MLRIDGLSVAYDHVLALRDCSLDVPQGGIVTLLGANGAGKTTMLHAIAGLVRARSGTIAFDGEPITGRAPAAIVRLGISLVPEHRQLFSEMTVEQNLVMGAYSRAAGRQINEDIAAIFELFSELAAFRQAPAAMLSGGQQQMLAIGRALMARPRLLLLDEPSLGLAPLLVDRVLTALQDINRRGVTILLVEQNALRAMPLSEWTFVLENGRIVLHGPSRDLINDHRIQASYLGTL
jgi:branched-chain amino acid transport system ATP-binding protein